MCNDKSVDIHQNFTYGSLNKIKCSERHAIKNNDSTRTAFHKKNIIKPSKFCQCRQVELTGLLNKHNNPHNHIYPATNNGLQLFKTGKNSTWNKK